ncbi:MAG: hypothetical protein IJ949_02660, partial [Oscillospiraceae bacterium]|nr:hypothetical protein [Oscillospiraceae bacterium]
IAVAEEMSKAYRENLIGTTHAVLFEERDGAFFRGIVGEFEGSKPRKILITRDEWREMKMRREEM